MKIKLALESKADKESTKLFKEEKLLEEKKAKEKAKEKEEADKNSTKLNNSSIGFSYTPSLFQMAGNMVNSLWYGKDNTEKKKR